MSFNLSYKFKNSSLLDQAFTHRSYLNEHKDQKLESNERLEFLGDAILELIVSLYLYQKYPSFSEGQLTSLRAKLVQTKTLSLVAKKLGINQKLKLSRGEKESEGHNNPSISADTFEALIGAIYQDGGFSKAYDFVTNTLLLPAEKSFTDKLPYDYKSHLQEIVQAKGKPSPTYKVIWSSGPDHNKIFNIAIFVGNKQLATGVGKSKQEGEQEAAKNALAILKVKS